MRLEICAVTGEALPKGGILETERVVAKLVGETQRVVEREGVDSTALLVNQIDAVLITDTRTDIEA